MIGKHLSFSFLFTSNYLSPSLKRNCVFLHMIYTSWFYSDSLCQQLVKVGFVFNVKFIFYSFSKIKNMESLCKGIEVIFLLLLLCVMLYLIFAI